MEAPPSWWLRAHPLPLLHVVFGGARVFPTEAKEQRKDQHRWDGMARKYASRSRRCRQSLSLLLLCERHRFLGREGGSTTSPGPRVRPSCPLAPPHHRPSRIAAVSFPHTAVLHVLSPPSREAQGWLL